MYLNRGNVMQRTVAILDILGYKNLVKKRPLSELAKEYEKFTDEEA